LGRKHVIRRNPLNKWSSIALPKDLGGWELKYVFPFAKALVGRNLWRLTQGNSLWTHVMNSKYFANLTIEEWFCVPLKSSRVSIVLKELVEAFPLEGKCKV
jgi:hypothetical protein